MDAKTTKRIQEQEKLNLEMIDEIRLAAERGMKFVTNLTFDQLLEKSKSFNKGYKEPEKNKK